MDDTQVNEGLIYGLELDGLGGGKSFGWKELPALIVGPTPVWVHLDRNQDTARAWLRNESGLGVLVTEALLAEDTRPRAAELDDGVLVILRGVNLNPGADPEDMVSLRIWFDATSVISVRIRRSMALQGIPEEIERGVGPKSCPDLVAEIVDRIVDRMEPVIDHLDEQIASIEAEVTSDRLPELRDSLASRRRQCIGLRRYVAPQRDALRSLVGNLTPPGGEKFVLRVREIADRATRYVEDLDAMRERASVAQDQLTNRIGEEMNRTMYLLSIVAALFLPLGFLTGLLGVNVAGIPGAEYPQAFNAFVLLLVVIVVLQLIVFRFLRIL